MNFNKRSLFYLKRPDKKKLVIACASPVSALMFMKIAATAHYATNCNPLRQHMITRGPGALYRAQEYHCNLALFFRT